MIVQAKRADKINRQVTSTRDTFVENLTQGFTHEIWLRQLGSEVLEVFTTGFIQLRNTGVRCLHDPEEVDGSFFDVNDSVEIFSYKYLKIV